ncbi:MAG TPA: RNA polymerase sigma factor [Jatrophihabitans sp.]|nr:RNA polymerase sigma factor [Jatrophihabitans sp.]
MAGTKPLAVPNAAGRGGYSLRGSARPAALAGSESRASTVAESDDGRITAAIAGDESAFIQLYLDTQPRLLRYAAGLIGQDAEEITAEAWLQIARDLPGFDGDLDAFRGWASRIVRNRAINSARARARRPVQPADLLAVLDRATEPDPADQALDNLATASAIALIARLPRDQAEAVLLRAVVGLDAGTAGKVLGKRPGAVRVAAHRGLKTLARLLAETDDGRERVPGKALKFRGDGGPGA